jgi:membrane protease YdiL (CAAX protease family)
MTPTHLVPYVLLGLAIVAVWFPWPPRPAPVRLPIPPPWTWLFTASCAAASYAGVLAPVGLVGLLALAALLRTANHARGLAIRALATVLAAAFVLLLALHDVPGFANVLALDRVRITPDAAPFTLYLNFDKGAAGLLVLAMLARRATDLPTFVRALRTGAIACVALVLPVVALGAAVGWFAFAPKLPPETLTFLLANLFLVCVAEDAFFRTFVQEPLHGMADRGLASRRAADGLSQAALRALPVVVTAALFGLAHAAGGWQYVLLSAVAGTGYAIAYARTRCVEAAITAHFCTNALHFLLFTYPRLA